MAELRLTEKYKRSAGCSLQQTLRIKDECGNEQHLDIGFHVPDEIKNYTYNDVLNIIDACIAIAIRTIEHGGSIDMRRFGKLALNYRAKRYVKNPDTNAWHTIDAHYTAKFKPGSDLKSAAALYTDRHPCDEPLVEDSVEFEEYFYGLTGEKLNKAESDEYGDCD